MRTDRPSTGTRVDHFGRSTPPTPTCGSPRLTAERTLNPARRTRKTRLTLAIRELQRGRINGGQPCFRANVGSGLSETHSAEDCGRAGISLINFDSCRACIARFVRLMTGSGQCRLRWTRDRAGSTRSRCSSGMARSAMQATQASSQPRVGLATGVASK
jgi:hypothetical protein